jgi:hypothetical protein
VSSRKVEKEGFVLIQLKQVEKKGGRKEEEK